MVETAPAFQLAVAMPAGEVRPHEIGNIATSRSRDGGTTSTAVAATDAKSAGARLPGIARHILWSRRVWWSEAFMVQNTGATGVDVAAVLRYDCVAQHPGIAKYGATTESGLAETRPFDFDRYFASLFDSQLLGLMREVRSPSSEITTSRGTAS